MNHIPYGASIHSVSSGDAAYRSARCVVFTNLVYVGLSQFGVPVCLTERHCDAENIHVVPIILRDATPFNIVRSVVRFTSVLVIHVWLIGRWLKKRNCDQSVNLVLRCLSFRKRDDVITFDVQRQFEKSYLRRTRSDFASYVSTIRDRINSLVTFDWTPLLERYKKLIGHKLFLVKVSVLAPLSIQLSGVNSLYRNLLSCERGIA